MLVTGLSTWMYFLFFLFLKKKKKKKKKKKTLLYSRMRISGLLKLWPPVFLRICKGSITDMRSYFGSGHPDIVWL